MNKVMFVSFVAVALMACSSHGGSEPAPTPNNSSNSDGNQTSNPDPNNSNSNNQQQPSQQPNMDPSTNPNPSPQNQAQCVAACETQYPKAAGLNKQLDSSCFTGGACEPVCDNLTPGKNYPPDTDAAAAACDLSGAWGIQTPSSACSSCIYSNKTCCSLWAQIFGSADGQSLSSCANKCYTEFKN